MRSPPFEFGSPAWFEQAPALSRVPDQPVLVVEHRTVAAGGAWFVHQQVFDEKGLVAWVPRRARASADLVLVRSAPVDAGDLLGLVPAAQVACNTSIEAQGKITDVLGIGSATRPGLEDYTVGTVDVCLRAQNSPFGDIEVALRLSPDGSQQIVDIADADCQATISADWTALAQWAHTDTLLGYLINDYEVELDGSFMVLSYVEGCVSWPKTSQDQHWSHCFLETMETYRRYRLDAAYLELMDEIEEAIPRATGTA